MIPQFDTRMEMIGYFRNLKNPNYANMLHREFGITAPEDAPSYQKEFLFKYMVQGRSFYGFKGDDLIDYATKKTKELVSVHPHLVTKNIDISLPVVSVSKVGESNETKVRHKIPKLQDGAVLYLEHRDVYVGYFGGKVVVTKKTAEAVKTTLKSKFNV